jgi:hypothetical protein
LRTGSQNKKVFTSQLRCARLSKVDLHLKHTVPVVFWVLTFSGIGIVMSKYN